VQGSFIIPVEGVLSYQCREFYHACVGIFIIPVQGVLSYLCREFYHTCVGECILSDNTVAFWLLKIEQ
jgi:hypothetical protein